MIHGNLDLGTIKGTGMRRIYSMLWVCPHVRCIKGDFPNMFIYCGQPEIERTEKDNGKRTIIFDINGGENK